MPDIVPTIAEGFALGLFVHFAGLAVAAMKTGFRVVADV